MCRESIGSICLPLALDQECGGVAGARCLQTWPVFFPFSSPRAPQRHDVSRELKVRGVPAPSMLSPPPRRSVESPDTGQESEDQVQTLH